MLNSCPLCKHQDHTLIYGRVPQFPDADIVRCDHCGHLYTLINTEIELDSLYADEVYKVVENRRSVFDRVLDREYRGFLRTLEGIRGSTGSLLDFGSGKGKLGSLAKSGGWQVRCVETASERAAYAREVYGLEVNSEFYSGGNIFNMCFDALSLFHVLEHLPDPKPLLEKLISDNLNQDGLVVIEVPNIGSWQASIAGNKWIHLDVPRHLSHFSPVRLRQFIEELGLEPVKSSYYSIHLGVLGMVDSLLRKLGYKGNIIYELKNKKSKALHFKIALVLPFALIMERAAAAMGRGGVVRVYARRKKQPIPINGK
jgi:2-polyprenyl-3-methyl-5-hydroxy-6-metoxy-1,4-benzoquinol methylase